MLTTFCRSIARILPLIRLNSNRVKKKGVSERRPFFFVRSRERLPVVRCPRTMSHGEREHSDRSERQRRGTRTRGKKHGAHHRGHAEHRETRTMPRLERERSDLNRRQRRALRCSLLLCVGCCVFLMVVVVHTREAAG